MWSNIISSDINSALNSAFGLYPLLREISGYEVKILHRFVTMTTMSCTKQAAPLTSCIVCALFDPSVT